MTRPCLTGWLPLAAVVVLSSPAAAQEPVEELLRLHHQQRVAHVLGDAELLTRSFASPLVEIGHGTVNTISRDAARERFAAYFNAVRFLEWEDARTPRVQIAPGGRWAEVVVEKRVRTLPADGGGRPEATRFAWVERWTRADGDWRLATIASTDGPVRSGAAGSAQGRTAPSAGSQRRAYDILRRAREAVGGEEAVARVATLRYVAECTGPGGPFTTEVASARDGRVLLAQRYPDGVTRMGLSLEGGWQQSADGPVVDSLGPVAHSVATGHEVHLLALAPEARYSAPRARAAEVMGGQDVDVVEFTDALGAAVRFYYHSGTGRPVGFRLMNHTGRGPEQVEARFTAWRPVDGVELPFEVTFMHGADAYHYRITDTSTSWLSDAAFRP